MRSDSCSRVSCTVHESWQPFGSTKATFRWDPLKTGATENGEVFSLRLCVDMTKQERCSVYARPVVDGVMTQHVFVYEGVLLQSSKYKRTRQLW